MFATLYEPLWYHNQHYSLWGPADTRVPTHSIFDHLYASAMSANLLTNSQGVKGLIVTVRVRSVGDWIKSSRKLSDMWVSSWLATALVWYAVKELVWCFGPDIIVEPGHRWNQFYLSLIKERIRSIPEIAEEIFKNYYYWEGFPYYAWHPASITIILPLLPKNFSLGGRCGQHSECEGIISLLKDSSLDEAEASIRDYIRRRIIEGWGRVVRSIIDKINSNNSSDLKELLKKIFESIEPVPPLEFDIVIEHINDNIESFKGKKGREKTVSAKTSFAKAVWRLNAELDARKVRPAPIGFQRILLSEDYDNGDAYKNYIKSIILNNDNIKNYIFECDDSKCEWMPCSVCRTSPAVFHVPGRDTPNGPSEEYKEFADELCKALGSLEGGNCWSMWRPVFRPGEKLCPYCLLKRFLGLPEFFGEAAERLIGYRPSREVRFPSTDDIAGLATKLSLLYLIIFIIISKILEQENNTLLGEKLQGLFKRLIPKEVLKEREAQEILGRIRILGETINLEDITGKLVNVARRASLARSIVHEKVIEKINNENEKEIENAIREMVRKRFWTPYLLYIGVEELYRTYEDLKEFFTGREKIAVGRLVLAGLILADVELRNLLETTEALKRDSSSGESRDSPSLADVLAMLAEALRSASVRLQSLDKNRDTLVKYLAGLFRDMAEALLKPRYYYSLVAFDADSMGLIRNGLLPEYPLKNSDVMSAKDYVYNIIKHHLDLCGLSVRLTQSNCKNKKYIIRSNIFSINYFDPRSPAWESDPILREAYRSGTLLVTPSYLVAVSHALAYLLLKSARVATLLGGIPVYMGGDEGLVLLPAWMPWSLLRTARIHYLRTIRRALGASGEIPVGENMGLAYAVLLRRIFWGSDSRHPGFLPVRSKGFSKHGKYYVPAIVSPGLSIAVRLSHYRDHLYSEVESGLLALEAVKRKGGDMTGISMGRVQPNTPGAAVEEGVSLYLIPNLPANTNPDSIDGLKRAGRPGALILYFTGLMAEGAISRTIAYSPYTLLPGGLRSLRTLLSLAGNGQAGVRVFEYLISRHASGGGTLQSLGEEEMRLLEEGAAELLESIGGSDALLTLLGAVNAVYMASYRGGTR